MRVIQARNVAEALPAGLGLLLSEGRREPSRNGPVLVAPWPVTTVYERPTERVLFSPARDANPFFHLAEVAWMLAGRRDAGFLDHFVRDFGDRFAERGQVPPVVHGAYGHRWRSALGFDQLDAVVEQLRAAPDSRQAVLQMWDARSEHGDGPIGCDDLRGSWRDRPCNTHAYLRVRGHDADRWPDGLVITPSDRVLDLTVCCRSNDAIWGAYGANAVHFSALQEYLAARIGVGVGTYYQVSNNFHAYEAELGRLLDRAERLRGDSRNHTNYANLPDYLVDDRYARPSVKPEPLVHDAAGFDGEVRYMLNAHETLGEGPPDEAIDEAVAGLKNIFLSRTIWPALRAHGWHKIRETQRCDDWLRQIEAPDWRVACTEWVMRRRSK